MNGGQDRCRHHDHLPVYERSGDGVGFVLSRPATRNDDWLIARRASRSARTPVADRRVSPCSRRSAGPDLPAAGRAAEAISGNAGIATRAIRKAPRCPLKSRFNGMSGPCAKEGATQPWAGRDLSDNMTPSISRKGQTENDRLTLDAASPRLMLVDHCEHSVPSASRMAPRITSNALAVRVSCAPVELSPHPGG
jgi:hypothetical protein